MAPVDTPAVPRRRAPGVLVALVPVAAVVAVDPAGRSPFVAAKWWAVSTLVWLVAVLVRRATATAPEPSLVQRAMAALVVWLGLTSLTGTAPAAAWLGSGERTYGWVTWATVLVALGTGMRLHRLDGGRSLLIGLAAAHVAAAIWCGLELLGLEPVSVASTGDRLLGPFGSAAVTASALLLLAPGGSAAGWSLRHDPHRPTATLGWLAVGAAPLSLVALGATGTRGAWLAAGATLVGLLVVARRRTAGRHLVAMAAVVAVTAVGSVGVADRLGDLFERAPGGGAGRLDEWHAALGVIADHPMLGVGPEGYLSAVVGHLDDHYARTYGRTVLVDRAHSGPLDMATIGGLPALAGWLVVLVAMGAVCTRAIRRGTGPWVGVAVGVVAYFVAQLVLFGVAPLDPVLALLVGILVGAFPGAPVHPLPRPRQHHGAVGTALGLGLLVCAAVGATHVLSDRALQRAIESDAATAADHARHATGWRPDLTAGWVVRAELALRSSDGAAALSAADDGLRWAPHDPVLRLAKGRALTLIAADDLQPDSARRAIDWLSTVAETDPANPAVHLSLGQARAVAGEADGAVDSFERAADLDPDDATALVAAARVEMAEGRTSDARRHLRQALDRDPTNADALVLWDELQRGAP